MTNGKFSVIGQSLPKIDAWAKVIGETRFADDLVLPRMAHAKLLRSPHPHALIKRIDTSRARALQGVYAVITGHDLPRVKLKTRTHTPLAEVARTLATVRDLTPEETAAATTENFRRFFGITRPASLAASGHKANE